MMYYDIMVYYGNIYYQSSFPIWYIHIYIYTGVEKRIPHDDILLVVTIYICNYIITYSTNHNLDIYILPIMIYYDIHSNNI